MNKIQELKQGSFIFECENALPEFLCDDMVARFEANLDDQYQGRVGSDVGEDTTLKKTTDLVVTGKDHWQDVQNNLFRSLAMALQKFSKLYPYFGEFKRFKDMGYNLQRYQKGEYYHWHIDADNEALASRQLVAIWYLNAPVKGKLILFPPFWTHQHRAAVIEKGVKYIATTWITFR